MLGFINNVTSRIAEYTYEARTIRAYKDVFGHEKRRNRSQLTVLTDMSEFAEYDSTVHTNDPIALARTMGRIEMLNHVKRMMRHRNLNQLDNEIAKMKEDEENARAI